MNVEEMYRFLMLIILNGFEAFPQYFGGIYQSEQQILFFIVFCNKHSLADFFFEKSD